ncbi:cysteine and histidine-rich domain-containing protein [Sitophilus oryzae]|uniref:Cysteine and histidine-rich domain-containing protein n=1 Tax=Sitophilus oryzae TaxID=7048 RepID=A0A6J2Y528_SITOR|nr:cysteine and histidine-rich domain-containing protein [Sitophilus oryzae]XP_030758110.1 cysteine and histidine-rich domain-containing protein [Sitophilus oryzae]XP_030758111.1 cysteine and histidine-rich domain-containing protein [Sitophilus oryzae]
MPGDENLLQCYNRGCGQKYSPDNNKEDSCVHHPGLPVFHDAYKGWSCCNKKCTDFTEFLNIKGCTVSLHSNIKPPEPEKPKQDVPDVKVVQVKPIVPTVLKRPPFDTPLVDITPEIAPSLQQQLEKIEQVSDVSAKKDTEIAIGTNCKNGGCTVSYSADSALNDSLCLHHPGVPIFHEGLKFWSCCQRKTTDFNAFLNQEGCKEGSHVWKKEDNDQNKVQCRWDYHQTGPYMVVSIYAKEYSPSKSVIKLNPIRLYVNLIFPKQNNVNFELDVELRGIINVAESKITMYGTKVEVKLKKAEAGSWAKLESRIIKKSESKPLPKKVTTPESLTPKIDAVDLSDL